MDGGARSAREYVAERHIFCISGAEGWSFCSCGARTGPLQTKTRVREWHRFHKRQIAELKRVLARKDRLQSESNALNRLMNKGADLTETEIREWLKLAISSLCGDRIHFSTSDKDADRYRREAKQVGKWVDQLASQQAELERLRGALTGILQTVERRMEGELEECRVCNCRNCTKIAGVLSNARAAPNPPAAERGDGK